MHSTLQVVVVADSREKLPYFSMFLEAAGPWSIGTMHKKRASGLGSPHIYLRTMWRGKAIAEPRTALNSYY